MAGEARTSDFLLSTATLMVGPSSKVMELTPEDHSVGLIKNVQVTTEPQFVTLTQGVENIEVAAVNTANPARLSGEVYEFTAKNMAYGAGIDASAGYEPIITQAALATAIADGGATVALATGSVTANAIVVGDFVVIQDTTVGDRVHVGKVASIAVDTLTLAAGYEMPTGQAYAVATTVVYKVRNIKIGTQQKRPTYGVKLVGLLPETGEPITVIFPKVRVTRGISLAFQNENFGNMPFEFMPMALLPADPYYPDFGSTKPFSILKR